MGYDRPNAMSLTTRAVEAIGRGHLVKQLVCEGIGVSLPLWDDGIDLIAHVSDEAGFEATPLQLKVSTNTYVGIDHKYRSQPKLKFVFIWLDKKNELADIFVMPYGELDRMFAKHSGTRSYESGFSTSRASREKRKFMEPFAFSKVRSLRGLIFS